MPAVRRPLVYYHFLTQFTLFIVSLALLMYVPNPPLSGLPRRIYFVACAVLIIQYGLRRKAKPWKFPPPSAARGFDVRAPPAPAQDADPPSR
jgi:hypothetical protein